MLDAQVSRAAVRCVVVSRGAAGAAKSAYSCCAHAGTDNSMFMMCKLIVALHNHPEWFKRSCRMSRTRCAANMAMPLTATFGPLLHRPYVVPSLQLSVPVSDRARAAALRVLRSAAYQFATSFAVCGVTTHSFAVAPPTCWPACRQCECKAVAGPSAGSAAGSKLACCIQ
jgi:hypothetical protein